MLSLDDIMQQRDVIGGLRIVEFYMNFCWPWWTGRSLRTRQTVQETRNANNPGSGHIGLSIRISQKAWRINQLRALPRTRLVTVHRVVATCFKIKIKSESHAVKLLLGDTRQAPRLGLVPKLITCLKWICYPCRLDKNKFYIPLKSLWMNQYIMF